MRIVRVSVFMICYLLQTTLGGYSSDAVRLTDIQVLTLYHGKMTNGRRSAPVPQLKCVGGTAANAFTPQVVQCYNRGSDGIDVQWECKTDMDNAYRFGQISVSCEGYAYPDDPYVLKGSCGLEYTIDFTKEGYENQGAKQHDYYRYSNNDKEQFYTYAKKTSSFIGNLILFAVVALMIYALYRTCLSPAAEQAYQSSTTNDDFRGYPGGDSYRPTAPPPAPGFRSEFTQGSGASGASCGSERQSGYGTGRTGSTGAGGFWTGAATGGLLGYMFGNRNNAGTTYTNTRYRSTPSPNTYSDNQFWGGTTRRSSGHSSGGGTSSSSTGTRTASGFGGTTRR